VDWVGVCLVKYKKVETTLGNYEETVSKFLKENPEWLLTGFDGHRDVEVYLNPGRKIQPYPSKWEHDHRNKVIVTFHLIEEGDMVGDY